MTNKQSPKKVVKNIEKPKIQRRNCEVIKHFEPSENFAACRSNLTVEIPLINVNSDNQLTSPTSPKTVHFPVKRQSIIKIPPPNITKYKNPIHDSSSKQIKNGQNQLFPTHSKLKSSSSSSLDAALDNNPNRYKAKPKSYYSNTKSIQPQKLVKSAGERGSVSQSKNGSLKSITDPALIQRELNLKALKQEILENKRTTAFERPRPNISHFKPSPQIEKLKAEILRSKTSNMLRKKLLITDLRSEISQYKHFNNYHVYNTFGDEPSKKPEKDDNKEPENENLIKTRAGSKKVSIADYVLKNEDNIKSGFAVEEIYSRRNEASSGGPSGTGTERESVIDITEGAKIWLSACGRNDLIEELDNLDVLRLCSAHFEDHMFESALKDRLVANAVPTILQGGSIMDDVQMTGSGEEDISTTNFSEAETACSSSGVGDYSDEPSEKPELSTAVDIKYEEKCLLDIPEIHESSVDIETTPLNKTRQIDQHVDIRPLTEQEVTDVGVGHDSELNELNIKSEADECIDDEFKEVNHEEMRVSNAHIDMFFESLLGVAKALTKDNQMILADRLKAIVNEYR